jgi:hypothetical protein
MISPEIQIRKSPKNSPVYSKTLGIAIYPAPIAVETRVNMDPLSEPWFICPNVREDQDLEELISSR